MAEKLDGEQIVARLRQMDAQIICSKGKHGEGTIFKQASDLIEDLRYPVPEVRGKKCVVLYFETDEDRKNFIQVVRQAKPNMKAMKL